MNIDEEKFHDWLANLVNRALPAKLKEKIVRCQNLTQAEMREFQDVVQLALQARSLQDHSEMKSDIKQLLKGMQKSLSNQNVILYHVSGEDPQYKTVAKEKTLRETVVDEAIKEIMTRPQEEERVIALKHYRKFEGVPGFYTKFDSFIRQVRRAMQCDSDAVTF